MLLQLSQGTHKKINLSIKLLAVILTFLTGLYYILTLTNESLSEIQ